MELESLEESVQENEFYGKDLDHADQSSQVQYSWTSITICFLMNLNDYLAKWDK